MLIVVGNFLLNGLWQLVCSSTRSLVFASEPGILFAVAFVVMVLSYDIHSTTTRQTPSITKTKRLAQIKHLVANSDWVSPTH